MKTQTTHIKKQLPNGLIVRTGVKITISQSESDPTTLECKRIRELTYSNTEKEIRKFNEKNK